MEENNDNLIEALIQSNDENSQEIQSVLEHNLQQNAKNGETLEQQLQVQDLTLEAQKETTKAVKEIAQNLNPQEIGDGMTFVVKGLKGDKGEQGDTPVINGLSSTELQIGTGIKSVFITNVGPLG